MRTGFLALLSVTIGLAAAIVLAELTLLTVGYSSKLVYEPNPYYGWGLPRSHRFLWRSEGRDVAVAVNSHGLRDRERGYGRSAGTFRVLAIGDSFTEALQVPLERSYVALLESGLHDREGAEKRPAEVINAGVSGFGTDNALLFFRHEGIRYEPDVVLLGFYVGNDVRNNLHELDLLDSGGARKPHFELRDGELELFDYPFMSHTSARTRLRVWLNRHVRTYGLVRDVRDRLQRPAPPGAGALQPPLDLPVFRRDPMPPWEEAWAITRALLKELDREVRDAGGQLVVVLIPTQHQVDPAAWQRLLQTYSLPEDDWGIDVPNARLVRMLSADGIPVIDLLPGFSRAAAAPENGGLYLAGDGHWSEAGHALAARLILDDWPVVP